MRVLLVERDTKISSRLVDDFTREGMRVEVTDTGEEALELVRHYEFDLVLLSLSLPCMAGLDVLRRLRAGRTDSPVVAMTTSTSPQARVQAFSAGADDVVTFPFEHTELLARMRAVLRRSRGYSQPVLQVGTVSLSLETREAAVGDKPVQLTGKEYAILELLMMRRNMVLTKETFLNHLYGGLDEPEPKIIDVFICKLRKKLAQAGAPDVIGTVWGRGYTVRDPNREGRPASTPEIPRPASWNPNGLALAS